MKSLRKPGIFLLIAVGIISLSSCENDEQKPIRGTGRVLIETRDLPIHRDISIAIPANVYIYQSQDKEVTLEAQANILDVIETRVLDSELVIQLKEGVELGDHEPIIMYISSALFNTIRLSGKINLYGETLVVTDVLDVVVSGTGEVDIKVHANTVVASITGNGKIWFKGETNAEVFSISGTGNIYAFDLLTDMADVSISGSGDIEIDVEEFLSAFISGNGNIYYRGYPAIKSLISGTGKLIHVN